MPVDGTIQLGYKNTAWFTANASLVLLVGQIVYLEQTGTYKLGDGVTQLSALSFLGLSAETQTLQAVTDLGANTTNQMQINGVNVATVNDFQAIAGVNKYLAQRILNYRKRIQGFTFQNQLLEVWKIDSTTVQRILNKFKIIGKPIIKKINVNTATFKQVLSNPYIEYDLCKKIFEFRDEVAELQSIEELKNIEGFPIDKYDRIVLYLEAK